MPDDLRHDDTWVYHIGSDPRSLEPLGQLSSEKHIGQLAVAIGKTTAVSFLPLEVMETDLATKVGH